MADGKGLRWNNYLNKPKHFIEVNGETIIGRIVRLLNEANPKAKVLITSHDKRYEIPGATRYEPQNNVLEIDRFTEELIQDDMIFFYGDTYYSDHAMNLILKTDTSDLLFFGNEKSIVAVKIKNAAIFKQHVQRVRQLFLEGKIDNCIGWQVYQSFTNTPFLEKIKTDKYVLVTDETQDFNTPEDLEGQSK